MTAAEPDRHADGDAPASRVDVPRVARLWAPLAASWLLMAAEPTLVIAAVSRLADPKVHLAAWSSVVFPVALVVEGPIIMMLAASTALSTDWERYRKVGRATFAAGLALTLAHAAIVFTPLYGVVAVDLLGSDERVVEPARLGLALMLPWTWAIAYRRYQQGALIRCERSEVVTQGTLLRLAASGGTLGALTVWGGLAGTAVAALGVIAGVVSEAVFAGWRARGIHPRLRAAAPTDEPLTRVGFARFYLPLALTPLVTLLVQPIGAAAMNRMPRALDSVAAWGPVHAFVFATRSVGMAFNEVVVTLVGVAGGPRALRRFGLGLAAATAGLLALAWATPLAALFFGGAQDVPRDLVPLAVAAVGLAVLMPAYQVAQSWFQGVLVHARTTRAITEAVLIYFGVAFVLLRVGIARSTVPGLHWAIGSFVVAGLLQTAWLGWRSRSARRTLAE